MEYLDRGFSVILLFIIPRIADAAVNNWTSQRITAILILSWGFESNMALGLVSQKMGKLWEWYRKAQLETKIIVTETYAKHSNISV